MFLRSFGYLPQSAFLFLFFEAGGCRIPEPNHEVNFFLKFLFDDFLQQFQIFEKKIPKAEIKKCRN